MFTFCEWGRSQCPASSGWWNLHDGRFTPTRLHVKFAHGLAGTAREDLWGDERGLWNRVVDVEGEGGVKVVTAASRPRKYFPSVGSEDAAGREEIAHAEQERRESNGDVSPQTVWVRTEQALELGREFAVVIRLVSNHAE